MSSENVVHAIIVAGGSGSRLAASAPSDVPAKPLLKDNSGFRLIDRALAACTGCTTRVVVAGPMELPKGVLRVRETPPLAGPAAAIAAGVRALESAGACDDDAVLLLAADLANPALAVAALVDHAHAKAESGKGCIGSVGGRWQPLLSLVPFGALREASTIDLTNSSVMRLLTRVGLEKLDILDLPASATADIDTWSDALAHGYGERYGRKDSE